MFRKQTTSPRGVLRSLFERKETRMGKYVREHVVEVRDSDIHGKGVFAKRAIRKGRRLGVYGGTLMTLEEHEEAFGDELPRYTLEIEPFQKSRVWYVDSSEEHCPPEFMHWTRHINDNRGTGLDTNVCFDSMGSVFAVRDIKVGEELLISYGSEYWEE